MTAHDSTPAASSTRCSTRSRASVLWTLGLTLLVNLVLLAIAWWDRSWFAMMIAVFLGPLMNGIVMLSGLLSASWLERNFSGFSSRQLVVSSISFPAAFAALDVFLIFGIGLSGC